MKTTFKKGFTHNGFTFGWHDGKLYRLPTFKSGRNYALKELVIRKYKDRLGKYREYYLIAEDKFTPLQAREKSVSINFKYSDEI